jgi:hypothetical protein
MREEWDPKNNPELISIEYSCKQMVSRDLTWLQEVKINKNKIRLQFISDYQIPNYSLFYRISYHVPPYCPRTIIVLDIWPNKYFRTNQL